MVVDLAPCSAQGSWSLGLARTGNCFGECGVVTVRRGVVSLKHAKRNSAQHPTPAKCRVSFCPSSQRVGHPPTELEEECGRGLRLTLGCFISELALDGLVQKRRKLL